MKEQLIKKYLSNIFGIIISRISGFLRDFFIAKFLGAGLYSDLFFVMIKIPSVFRSLFTEGVFNQSFLPNLAKADKKGAFCVQILAIFSIFLFFSCLIISLFSEFFMRFIAFGFSDENIKNASFLLSINIWYVLLIFSASFFASLLNFSGRFLLTSLSSSFFNFACIFGLIYAKNQSKMDMLFYMSIFIIISSFLQLIMLLIALRKNKILQAMWLFLRQKRVEFQRLKGFFKNFFASLLAASSQQLNSLIEIALASTLVHASISYINYSTRIYQLPLALIAIAFTQVFFPSLIRLIKQNDEKNAIKKLQKIFEMMAFLLILSAIGGFVLSEEVIKILFMRGAFSEQNALECAALLKGYIFLIIPLGLSKLFLAWINANFLHKKAALISIISCFLSTAVSLIALKFYGIFAFCLSANISAIFVFLAYLKIFGYLRFLAILRLKIWLFIILFSLFFAWLIYLLKGIIDAFI